MRCFRYLLYTIFILVNSNILFATGQASEIIIFKGDTLEMLSLPLETFFTSKESREEFNEYIKIGCCSTGLYRGYVGHWVIKDDKLFLINVFAGGEQSFPVKNLLFKDKLGDIFAEWYTGELFIEKGKLLKYNHSGFDRCYETEYAIRIENGKVIEIKEYKNGVKPDDKNFPLDIELIRSEIYKQIDWKSFPRLSKKLKVYVTFRITKTGKLEFIGAMDEVDKVYIDQLEKVINEFPEVQIFYARGKPLIEEWSVPFFFNRTIRRKHTR